MATGSTILKIDGVYFDTGKGISGSINFTSSGISINSSLTGSTGYFQYLTSDKLSGKTAYFDNVITSKIGNNAGQFNQGSNALAIGVYAGSTGQGTNAIAIGYHAGEFGQGENSIAIGAFAGGPTGLAPNSIILNASGKPQISSKTGFYVNPVGSYSGSTGSFKMLAYGADNQIVTVEGSATSTSSVDKTNDTWSLENLVNAPPFVSVTGDFRSSDAYISFTYPKQIYSSFGLLPTISSMYVNLGSTAPTSFTIQNTNMTYQCTGTNYIGVTGSSNFIATTLNTNFIKSSIVQCIRISKSAPTGTTGLYNGMLYSTINYPSPAGTKTPFYLWYGNGNPNVNISSLNGGFMFILSDIPLPIPTFTVSAISYNNISINWTGSPQVDKSDVTSTANFNYNISYQPTGTNNYRYGGIQNTNIVDYLTINTGTTGGSNTNIISNSATHQIFPDTNYFVTINASNSLLTNTGTFTTSTTTIGTTGPPVPTPQISGSTSISAVVFNAKKITDSSSITNLLQTNTNGLSFTVPVVNIHNSMNTRGSTGASLVNFTSSLNDTQGPTYSLNGFSGNYNYAKNTTNGISIQAGTPTDQYSSGPTGLAGYYLKVPTTLSTTSANLIGAASLYKLSMTGTYVDGTSSNYYTNFYYDGEVTTASINTPMLSIKSAVTGSICGITTIISATLTLTTPGVTGYGNYFYNNSHILAYSSTTGTLSVNTEKNLTNFTSSTQTFTNNIGLTGLTFGNSFAVNVTPYNLFVTPGTLRTSNSITGLYDTVSSILTTIPNVSTASIVGARIYSTTNAGTVETIKPNNTLANFTNAGNSYSTMSPLYDNKSSIYSSYTTELLYLNGMYVTPSTTPNYYLNYSNYYANTVDYSSIRPTTYRYATFAWKVDPLIFTNTTTYGKITFNLNGFSGGSTTNNIFYTDASNPLFLWYRIEDSGLLTIATQSTFNNITSYWINANDSVTTGTLINSNNNYIGVINGYYIGTSQPAAIISGSNVTFPAKTAGYDLSSVSSLFGSVYIYCRVGVSMNSNFSFKNISCILSQ